jgi:diguanylate cyclase
VTDFWEFISSALQSVVTVVDDGARSSSILRFAGLAAYTVAVFVLGRLSSRVNRATRLASIGKVSPQATNVAGAATDCDNLLDEIRQELVTHSQSARELNEQLDSPDHDLIRDRAKGTRKENSKFQQFLQNRCSQLERQQDSPGGTLKKFIQNLAGHRRRVSELDVVLAKFEDSDQFEAAISPLRECIRSLQDHNQRLQDELDRTRQAVAQQSQKLEQAQEDARVDALTGLPNRRAFDERINRSHSLFVHGEPPYVVAILDIDHFKKFNDEYGHATGDEVLKLVAGILRRSLRGADHVARFGGEEFIILLPRSTGHKAKSVVDRHRKLIEQHSLTLNVQQLGVTVSAGVSEVRPGDTIFSVLARADEALYAAKNAGRNQTCLEDDGTIVYVDRLRSPETATPV